MESPERASGSIVLQTIGWPLPLKIQMPEVCRQEVWRGQKFGLSKAILLIAGLAVRPMGD